jgi:hypothetical protein
VAARQVVCAPVIALHVVLSLWGRHVATANWY